MYHPCMKNKGVALVEIVVSMLLLAVSALAVTATVSMVNSPQMRSSGGGSRDLQALSYAKQTLDSLKNAVSQNATTAEPLDIATDVVTTAPTGFTRTYTVSSVSGTDLKKVTVKVSWTD